MSEDRYVRVDRGDRLQPSRFNTRYHALKQLAQAMREAAAHPAVTGALIVDYGCADAPYRSLLAPRFERYLTADLAGNDRADITIARDGGLPLASGVASAVLSSQVLEHVPDPRRYLAEAHRVLAPDGVLLLSTHGAWRYHPDPTDYWRWTREGLELELDNAGFHPIWMRGVLGPSATAVQLLQDSLAVALPRGLNRLPGLLLQPVVGVLERVRRDPTPVDAATYVIIARRGQPATSS